MAAGIYNFTIEQGTTFQRTFKYKNADGTPKSLTGADDIRMQIRPSVDSTDTPIADFDIDDFTRAIPDGDGHSVQNQFTLTISATETAAYTFGTAVYDLEIQEGGTVIRLLQGKIKLSKEVTR